MRNKKQTEKIVKVRIAKQIDETFRFVNQYENNKINSLEDFMEYAKVFAKKYKEISLLFKKNNISFTNEFNNLTKNLSEVQKKVYAQLFKAYYPDSALVGLRRDYAEHRLVMSEILQELQKKGPGFWAEHQKWNEEFNNIPKLTGTKEHKSFEKPRLISQGEILSNFIAEIRNFNKVFENLNDEFLDMINREPYHLHLTLTNVDKEEFTKICELQKQMKNTLEGKLRELEARPEVKQVLLGYEMSLNKENLETTDDNNIKV